MTSTLRSMIAGLGIVLVGLSHDASSAERIPRDITRQVERYAHAIACPGVQVDPRMGVVLSRFNGIDARYVVLWEGDIGCSGGSGSQRTHMAMVTLGAARTVVVDPLQSSPAIRFESSVRVIDRIVGHTRDTLTLEGKAHGPKDAECCPSVAVRFILRSDKKGNWLLASNMMLGNP